VAEPQTAGDGVDEEDDRPNRIFTTDGLNRELRHGEILSGLVEYNFDEEADRVEATTHEYVVVLSQDCDLLWDYERRQQDKPGTLNAVVLYQARLSTQIRSEHQIGHQIWKRLLQNREERYHALEQVPSERDLMCIGIGPLVVDFKMMFAVSPLAIYKQLARGSGARRRCRLEVPYREHLQCRAAFYFQRVALPEPHRFDGA
jgi:hypothetical protein